MPRKMKDSGVSWIGQIPESWSLGRTKNCYTNAKQVAGEEADNYERLALTLNGVIKRPKDDATGLQPEAFNGYQILRKNELVFKLIDLANVATSRVGYSPYEGIVSPAYIILHPKNEEESKFGEYYFLSMWQREIFNHMGDDGVRSSLNAGELLNIPYPLVPSDEKKRIAQFLDKQCAEIDTVIAKTKATIEEYKKLKQSVIT
jgi:type I restriction enzyme S subunit